MGERGRSSEHLDVGYADNRTLLAKAVGLVEVSHISIILRHEKLLHMLLLEHSRGPERQ